MFSLANAFTNEELEAWEARNARITPEVKAGGYTTEIKIDGAAVSLTYERGRFVSGATRGNGLVGEVITENLKTIPEVPLILKGSGHPALMEVRGEVYMSRQAFERLNREQEEAGEPLYANPRNTAAGTPQVARLPDYQAPTPPDVRLPCRGHRRKVRGHVSMGDSRGARGLGVPGGDPSQAACDSPGGAARSRQQRAVATLAAVRGRWHRREGGSPRLLHQELGIVGGREPRWAIARKFAPEVAVTRLLDIGINVGRTGALNPYARLEPVEVSGVTVSNATLHNEDLIEQKDIRIGDWVEVMRAGEVIPQIIGPIRERRDGSEQPFKMPDKCPACGTPVERPPDEAMRYCPNATCPGRVLEGIVHFASRDAMDIRGLGYERVRQLLDAKLIQDVSDLYQLSAERLVELDRFAKQSANQLVAAIAASRDRPFPSSCSALESATSGRTSPSYSRGASAAWKR